MFFFLVLLALAFFSPQPAMAYLDPAAGSYMIQAAFGLFLSMFVSLKAFFCPRFRKNAAQKCPAETNQDNEVQ